ncbi:hypothetical protein CVT25_007971 [Psilocybe cyanescens]|uniref:Uncharacterized protein n=1 Tax=Psilocybe cyanescens TaxID=93625 RepID=A0A409XMX3_PSICY|nr:hypothetical protein CVT25_007971 [Psilocybe cyanescens]
MLLSAIPPASAVPEISPARIRGPNLSKHTSLFRKTFSRLLGKTKAVNIDHRRTPPFGTIVRRGRSRFRTSRATSAPRLHISHRSLSPQLTTFPPPPAHFSINHDPKTRGQREHRRTTAVNILRSRPLPSRRLSERDPVLSRPYSPFLNSSRNSSRSRSSRSSSIQPLSVAENSRARLNRYSLSPPAARSPNTPLLSPEPWALSSRLVRPLPLPPGRASREHEWEKSSNNIHKHEFNRNTRIVSPRATLPRTFPSRHTRSYSAHLYPSKSYLSRSLGSFFSDLPSILPSPPSSEGSSACSRASSRRASANDALNHTNMSSTTLVTPPSSPFSVDDGSVLNLHKPSSSTLTF